MHKITLNHNFSVIACVLMLFSTSCLAQQTIAFWNGNKSASRQQYEAKILDAALMATKEQYGDYRINQDDADLSSSAESAVFRTNRADVFVTVAGNPKLEHEEKIIVTHPLMRGLLGYRLLIVRDKALGKFAAIQTEEEFKRLRIGISEGWADADLFRHNDYRVVEGGTFDEIFDRLAADKFDYIALGANEIETTFANRAAPYDMFSIEPTTLLYYPFALVFYVNPEKPALAQRLHDGLNAIDENGQAQRLFEQAAGNIVERLQLPQRTVFRLDNPMLPAEMKGYRSRLLEQQAQ